jgi:hypothetical protein
MSTVKVKADKNGNIIHVSENNPEYGWFFVEQNTTEFLNGWLRSTTRSSRINGKVEDLKNANLKKDMEMPGKIVIKESLIPFNEENPDRDLKIAGTTGVICRYDDQPIYRKTFVSNDLNAEDEFISHTNKEEIKQVMEAQRAMALLNSAPVVEEPTL